jgi:hypothetical protein
LKYLRESPLWLPPRGRIRKEQLEMEIIIGIENICFYFSPFGGNPEGKGGF